MKSLAKESRRNGFTLIELVVVIAILGILMAIAIPKLSGYMDNAAVKADQATAVTIGQAIELYMIDENEIEDSTSSQTDFILEKLEKADLINKDNCKPQYKKDDLKFEIIYSGKKLTISYNSDVKAGGKVYRKLYPKIEYKDDETRQ